VEVTVNTVVVVATATVRVIAVAVAAVIIAVLRGSRLRFKVLLMVLRLMPVNEKQVHL